MPRWGSVKDHMIISLDQFIVGQKCGEFIKRGNLDGAGPRQLFFNAAQGVFRQNIPHRAYDPFTVIGGSFFRVDFYCIKARRLGDCSDLVADVGFKNLPDVGRRISADQQRLFAISGQIKRRCASERGFTNAPLTGEENEFGQVFKHGLGHFSCGSVV